MTVPRLVRTGIAEMLPMQRTGHPDDHISSVIRSLCLRLGHFTDDGSEPNQVRFELGSAFEDALIAALVNRHAAHSPHRYARVGELTHDGMIGTPDLYDIDAASVVEVKLTWMSSRHEPESVKFWKYWRQVQCYCTMLGVSRGELHVCHVMGDYARGKDSTGPVYNVWDWTWTQQELNDNWRMIKTHREAMKIAERLNAPAKGGAR